MTPPAQSRGSPRKELVKGCRFGSSCRMPAPNPRIARNSAPYVRCALGSRTRQRQPERPGSTVIYAHLCTMRTVSASLPLARTLDSSSTSSKYWQTLCAERVANQPHDLSRARVSPWWEWAERVLAGWLADADERDGQGGQGELAASMRSSNPTN
jgi:hypothetical protein